MCLACSGGKMFNMNITTRIAAVILTGLIASAALIAPAHAELDGPDCVDNSACDYWRSTADNADQRAAEANERAEVAEAQLLTHAGEFASLRFQVTTLRADLADQRRETTSAWRAEQRQRRVAERYYLRVLKMQERLTLLRIKLGLPPVQP